MQGGEESGRGRVVVLFDKSQKSSGTVSLHIYNIGFYFKIVHSNMILVFCLYKQRTQIPLLISRYTTVLLSEGTTRTYYFRSVILAVLIQRK